MERDSVKVARQGGGRLRTLYIRKKKLEWSGGGVEEEEGVNQPPPPGGWKKGEGEKKQKLLRVTWKWEIRRFRADGCWIG